MSPLDTIGRCEPVFAADQQERRVRPSFDFVHPLEEFDLHGRAKDGRFVIMARGDFWARVRAEWCDASWSYRTQIIGYYADPACEVALGDCELSRAALGDLRSNCESDRYLAALDTEAADRASAMED